MDQINLEGAYEQLKEEMPLPIKTDCVGCNKKLITQLDVSYIPDRDLRIKLFRPAYCQDCTEQNGIFVKLVGEISGEGKFYPKNKKGPVE